MKHSPSITQEPKSSTVLLIDNYDSFTYNLAQQVRGHGMTVYVARNDEIPLSDVTHMRPGAIVLSPGPGHPEKPQDVGICPELISYAERTRTALLGVCLGHQLLGSFYGGKIGRAPDPVHGKTSRVERLETPELSYPNILEGLGSHFEAMRYHSLFVKSAPKQLAITAEVRDALHMIMALQHRELPLYGVQFHPESYRTPVGDVLMRHFLTVAKLLPREREGAGVIHTKGNREHFCHRMPFELRELQQSIRLHDVEEHEFPCDLPPEEVYAKLHSPQNSYCLESLGTRAADRVSYFGCAPAFTIKGRNDRLFIHQTQSVHTEGQSPFALLWYLMEEMQVGQKQDDLVSYDRPAFRGGFVGMLGYEAAQYLEPDAFPGRTPAGEPTFEFAFYTDGLVYEPDINGVSGNYRYFTRGKDRRGMLADLLRQPVHHLPTKLSLRSPGMSCKKYKEKVRRIQREEIATGNAFQVVLARHEEYNMQGSMAPLYCRLREACPSDYMHAIKMDDVESIGSFPEVALCVLPDRIARVVALAGTRKRTGKREVDDAHFVLLKNDEKELAEHLMLVDLTRNDLNRICVYGADVTDPLYRKDAGPVMHLSSTVQGFLRDGVHPLQALLGATPMGTVSGAPKVRAMQIIHKHEEGRARGLYGGCFGFIGLGGGAQFVVGLRSLMRRGNSLRIGAGAGIVHDSVPQSEFEETEAKMTMARSVIAPFLK